MSTPIVNSAHPEGPTCLSFSRDGSRAYTGGSDCLVRIWQTDLGGDQEPEIATDATQGITTLSAARECWISGSEEGEVRRYEKHKPVLEGFVTSSNAIPIRCVSVNPNGDRVAIASEELDVKVIDLDDIGKIDILKGHTRAVRRVTWHPSGTLLSTCGSDGKIIIWDVSGEVKQEKIIEGVLPTIKDTLSPEFSYDCSAIWHPSGQHFFIASRAHEIITVSRSTWSKSSTFADDSVSGPTTALALSSNGLYLATSSRFMVYIWSTQTRRLLYQHKGEPNAPVMQLAFCPSQNLLAWTDSSGTLTRWTNPIPPSAPDPVKHPLPSALTKNAQSNATSALFDDEETEKPYDGAMDSALDLGEDGDDWIIDDVGMLDEEQEIGSRKEGLVKEMVSITKAQPAFQPGSTPMENKKRYLAYNMVGVIEVTDQETHHIVNVEFHDQSARKGYYFTDHFKYNLGYLGERGAVFACQPENKHPAQVYYKPYTSWTSQSEWTYSLPSSSSSSIKIISIAAGGMPPTDSLRRNAEDDLQGFGDVVIASSDGDLTFLSGTGRERRIMGLGSEVVSMVASVEWVFVVYRTGSTTIDGSQNLSYSMINFEDFTVRQRDVLPIPKAHVLKWLGITGDGAPAIYDSTGRIHVLTKFRIPHHASWARILDTNILARREGKDESYWPVGITGDKFMCLILKGRQEHPAFPRPLIQELDVRMPFRRNDPKDSPLEERVARETLLLELARDSLGETLTTDEISRREMEMDKEFIQLIQIACKNDNIPRAIELSKLLHHSVSLNMAVKVAEFYHLVGLQEKMEILKAKREEDEDRLVAARIKRMQWLNTDPLPRRLPDIVSTSSRTDPFQDFGPPPAIYRPGLARAIPTVETTRFSANNHPNGGIPSVLAPASPTVPAPESVSMEGKRKRLDDDDLRGDSDDVSKRRAVDEVSEPTFKPKQNPFAKKSTQDSGRNSNPFARKSEPNRSIHKGESFFDKVDAVEANKSKGSSSKGKEKAKKDGHRQMTLFGLATGQQSDKKVQNKKMDTATPTQDANIIDSQLNDVVPESVPSTLADSQSAEDDLQTERIVESQDRTQTQTIDSQEPIDWPPSPQTVPREISVDA